MTERGKQNIKTLVTYAMIGIIFAFTYMVMHEQVHAAIFRSYGISSVSRIDWLSASTQPLNQTEYDLKCTPNCVLANNMAEVIGYNLAILIFCLTGLFCMNQLIGNRTEHIAKMIRGEVQR